MKNIYLQNNLNRVFQVLLFYLPLLLILLLFFISSFVVSGFNFSFKLDSSTKFSLFIFASNYVFRKFIIISSGNI